MAATRPRSRVRVTAPELEQFIVATVELTGRVLGAGAYGSVEEVEIPGATVAAKKLHETLVNLGSPQQVDKWVRDFVEECKLMSQLRHPHIVQFLGVCYLPGAPLPVLLMEKLLTSLDNLLETNPNIPIHVKVHLLVGTSRGLVYLHSRTPPIAHRDLSAKNILVDSGLNAKIADLGVSRIVNVRPGQLAATMTQMPGTGVYMPPEASQEEGATRYNTGIDIFSLGAVSLFTFTQTFPKNLKPPNYRDPVTRRIVGRSEIERREDYVVVMKAALGETHPLVELTLECLEYDQEDRPSAVVVLGRLEEVGRALPQNCTQTKLQLIQQREEEIQQATDRVATEKQAEIDSTKRLHLEEIDQRDTGINQLHREIVQTRHENDSRIARLQAEKQDKDAQIAQLQAAVDRLQAENVEQVRGLEELSGEMRLLRIQALGQREVTDARVKPPPRPVVPSSITFNWARCKNRPEGMRVYGQPVTVKGKLYMRGRYNNVTHTMLVYTPDQDHWDVLPPPPVKWFTVATLRGQLLVVGGRDKSTDKKTNTILTFDEISRQWLQSLPPMPVAVTCPAVVEYQDHLIVAGEQDSNKTWTTYVNILDTTTNKWTAAEPLPNADIYKTCLIEDTLYLVGSTTKQVFRADVPSLISRASSGVWETVASVPLYQSYPVTVGNTLLAVGGYDESKFTADIHLYDPTKDKWTKCGDLPESMNCDCTVLSDKLYVFGSLLSSSWLSSSPSVYMSTLSITH